MAFRGHYEHSLDAKNRLSIPAKFRASFAEGLVISKDVDDCVGITTSGAYEKKMDTALAGLNPFSREYKVMQRRYTANSFDVELDASGRVTLPGTLLEHAGISKEVVIAGVGDGLEVWSRNRWDKLQAELDDEVGEVTASLGDAS